MFYYHLTKCKETQSSYSISISADFSPKNCLKIFFSQTYCLFTQIDFMQK